MPVEFCRPVSCDRHQPRADRVAIAKRVKLVVRKDENVLNNILNLIVRYAREHDSMNERCKHLVDLTKRLAIAGTDSIHELSFRRPAVRRRMDSTTQNKHIWGYLDLRHFRNLRVNSERVY